MTLTDDEKRALVAASEREETLRMVLACVKHRAEVIGKKTHAGCSDEYMRGRDDAIRSILHDLDGDPINPGAYIVGKRGTEYQLRLEARVKALENASSRLERARAKLKEWVAKASESSFAAGMTNIVQRDGERWAVSMRWTGSGLNDLEPHELRDDPLTAVIEASKRTPWALEE